MIFIPKFRVVYAVSYDVEAPSELEAYEKAYEMLAKEMGSEAADAVAEVFGVHIESLEGE